MTWDGAPLVSVMPLSLSRPPEPATAGAGVTGEATAESGARARPGEPGPSHQYCHTLASGSS